VNRYNLLLTIYDLQIEEGRGVVFRHRTMGEVSVSLEVSVSVSKSGEVLAGFAKSYAAPGKFESSKVLKLKYSSRVGSGEVLKQGEVLKF
jgi:hypothetical protein